MKIKVHSGELSRIMKTVTRCLDSKTPSRANIEISHVDDRLRIRGTNGIFQAEMSTPLADGDGESFCVDGAMFAKVISTCRGMVDIVTDQRSCVVKSTGRTRIQLVECTVPAMPEISGESVEIRAEDFKACYSRVSYAVAMDQSRIVLTGILTETDGSVMKMVALDGFQMAMDSVPCLGDSVRMVIPGAFMDLLSSAVESSQKITLITDGKRIQASTGDATLSCSLIAGEYIDYGKILPENFATETIVKTENVVDALKSGSIVNSKQRLVRVDVSDTNLKIMSNSEEADYEANIDCDTHGDGLKIGFNDRYLMNAMNALKADEAILKFNTPVSPVVIQGKDENGIHLCLPVRTMGA